MHIVLTANGTFFKVTTSHTLFQLVYMLHPLMPTKYLLPTTNPQTSDELSKLEFWQVDYWNYRKTLMESCFMGTTKLQDFIFFPWGIVFYGSKTKENTYKKVQRIIVWSTSTSWRFLDLDFKGLEAQI